MKICLLYIFTFSHLLLAQEPPLGTNRSEGLRVKAKMDYEKKNQQTPQSVNGQTQAPPKAETRAQSSGEAMVPSNKSLNCKSGNETRSLNLEYKGHGCELFYVKAGQNNSQARQVNGTAICESVYEKMKSTLEKTGFACESK